MKFNSMNFRLNHTTSHLHDIFKMMSYYIAQIRYLLFSSVLSCGLLLSESVWQIEFSAFEFVLLSVWSQFPNLAAVLILLSSTQVLTQSVRKFKKARQKLIEGQGPYAALLNFNRSQFVGKSELIEQTINLMNQGVAVVRPDGRFWLYNQRALEYAGIEDPPFPCSARSILEMQLANKEFGDHGELLPEAVRAFLLEGKGKPPKSYIRRRPNGTILEIRSDPMPDGSVIQTYTDITELAEAKAAAESAARSKAIFLATMSHEVRTPLNGIIGATQLLQHSLMSAHQSACVETLSACAEALLTVINDILEYSKLESSTIQLEPVPTSPAEICRSAMRMISSAAEAKQLTLLCENLDLLPAFILADGKRIQQILVNFLGNALKFTDEGHITLRALVLHQPEGPVMRLSVTDTGIGISHETLPRLFEEFVQGDHAAHRQAAGTGLGLAISKRLATTMGGHVGASSQLGAGSCFWCDLPMHICAEPGPFERSRTGASTPISQKRILVAEDIATNRMVIEGLLNHVGHQVTLVPSGLAAIQKLSSETFDLVFLDMRMPGLDGLETARQIRSMQGLHALPIVAMTANSFPTDRDACFAAGMNGFLSKPVRLDEITEMINRVCPAAASDQPAVPRPPAQALALATRIAESSSSRAA